jgi:valyl-tRNA synthetase
LALSLIMHAIELEKVYNPKNFETKIYKKWRENGAFTPKNEGETHYSVVIPPPNVTGVLHMGHALNITLQDIAVRFHRMLGERTLWVPGTDHAGIATQNVVEKKLRTLGKKRAEIGREAFLKETWAVTEDHRAIITEQIERMGAGVDWERERFTLDEGLSQAVREVFVTLYERGLIYKGERLVNWCCSCGTALADDEVEHEENPGAMHHIRYPFADGEGSLIIATTRPETLLGDTAVAVHPQDGRWAHLAGKLLVLPLTGRLIPLITDEAVDKDFGTGCVKITPAHDINDWETGKRHNLPVINILNAEGRISAEGPYKGLTVKEARASVIEDLKSGGYFIKEEPITHAVGRCYRCHTVIEPFLSEQWFVKMKPLAQKALAGWKNGDFAFFPKKWENTYEHWLTNIRDWCISRQLWWGHRIPAWTCDSCGKLLISREDITKCPDCGGSVKQDPDVLDTWFSSWLWPFSVLGWPKSANRADMDFYPTTALVTAYDIIFFWVARMIMAGYEFTGKAPFRDVYIHGLVRDKLGRKMSKSLGNGINPLELIDEYGADALKFTLAFLCAQGQDVLIDKSSFKLGTKFANKVWNAGRYILMNLEGFSPVQNPPLLPVDEWMYSRLEAASGSVKQSLLSYRYNDAAETVYSFFWNDFCDWYVEATKLSTHEGAAAGGGEKDRALTVLLDVFSKVLRLLHPFLPFLTEEIWEKLPSDFKGKAGILAFSEYPLTSGLFNKAVEADFALIQEIVVLVRTLRSECAIPAAKKIRVRAVCGKEALRILFTGNSALIKRFAGLGVLEIAAEQGPECAGSILLAGNGFEALVFVAEAVDMDFLKAKFEKTITSDSKYIEALENKLSGEKFVQNAPAALVLEERKKLEEAKERRSKLERWLKSVK